MQQPKKNTWEEMELTCQYQIQKSMLKAFLHFRNFPLTHLQTGIH